MEKENIRDENSCSDSTDADWIRNWLFSGLKGSERNHLTDRWKIIEEKFQISPDWLGEFIFDYVTLKSDNLEYIQRRYNDEIKERFIELLSSHMEENLNSLPRYAEFYSDYVLANDLDYSSKINEHRSLRLTGYTPAILIMKLRDLLESGKLSQETYKKMLTLLESYRIRLAVTGKPNHWEVFYKMTSLICENDPLESFLNAMINVKNKDTEYEFPDDKLFRKKLKKVDFYGSDYLSYDWCRLILYRLKHYNSDELSPPEQNFEIEHVMPFTYNDNWSVSKADHSIWCNNIGNLTLVPSLNLNQQLSARSFDEKRKIANSYIKIANRFKLDESVWDSKTWTIDEIKDRGEKLANEAIDIWPNLHRI